MVKYPTCPDDKQFPTLNDLLQADVMEIESTEDPGREFEQNLNE